MLIRDLPTEEREGFRALIEQAGQSWEVIQGLTIQEAHDWMQTLAGDSSASLERERRRLAVEKGLERAGAHPISERYPDRLHGKGRILSARRKRARFQELMRVVAGEYRKWAAGCGGAPPRPAVVASSC